MRFLPTFFRVESRRRVSPSLAPEMMDDPECDPAMLGRALEALSTVNRWFGGFGAIRRPIERALAGQSPREIALLDVGTGAGDIPAALERRLRAAGWKVRFCLADNHAATLRIARCGVLSGAAKPTFVRLDAPRLPFADDAFDIGFTGAMVHHLESEAAVEFLREIDRVSRLGWVVSDLRRGAPIRLAVGLFGATIWRRNEPARVDGGASIRRAFTASEAQELLTSAGLADAVVRSGPFRWLALGGELAEGRFS